MTVQRTRSVPARLLKGFLLGALALGLLVTGSRGTQDAIANGDTRTLAIRQMHTGERIEVTFRRNGRYDREALRQLDWILRDWRRDASRQMDPRLFDVLWEVHRQSRSRSPLHVVSAYRSPQTNEMLRSRSRAVARSSQHIEGKAVDFYLPDVSASRLREIGMRLQRGGVGFYPRANTPFVHIDVGSVRHWPRMSRSQLASMFPDGRTVHLPADGRPMSGYDQARREILAAGGVVAGEAGTAVARAGGQRSLWAALFGGDESEASADEAYAALPMGRDGDERYALLHSPAAPAPDPVPEPAPVRSAAPEPEPEPAPAPAAPPAPIAAPTPPLAIAAAPLPPVRPSDLAPPAPVPDATARVEIAALAAAASAVEPPAPPAPVSGGDAAFQTASASAVAIPAPPTRPAEFGGLGTVAQLPPVESGPRLVWQAGPSGTLVGTAALPATAAVDTAALAAAAAATTASAVPMPLPPRHPDRPAPALAPTAVAVAVAAPLPPAAPPRTATAFADTAPPAPVPPLRTAGLGDLTAALGLNERPAAPLPTAPIPTASIPAPAARAEPAVAALPDPERAALRTLFENRSLAPQAQTPAVGEIRVSAASVRDATPSGLVAVPASGFDQRFTQTAAALPSGFRAGPAVRLGGIR